MKQFVTLAMFFVFIAMTIPAAAQVAAPPSGHESHGAQETVKLIFYSCSKIVVLF